MAKQSYKIPASLNKSFTDMEIAIQGSNGIGLRPLPVKVLLFCVCSIIACFWIVTQTPVGAAPTWVIVLFVIVWAILTFFLVRTDGTQRMTLTMLPSALDYIFKSHRKIGTRTSEDAVPFRNFVGIDEINDDGVIRFTDKTVGCMYRVVGSASILLFNSDRDRIIDRVDSFYRKIDTDVEFITVTVKESQKIYRQAAALQKRYDKLIFDDPDLKALAQEQFDILKNNVGGTFKSIHQYMIIKAENDEAFQRALNVFRSEYENSSYMIRTCTRLDQEDICDFLKMLFQE